MTSKEALNKLWIGCVGKAMIEEKNIIENDLKVLEILKSKNVDYKWLKATNEYKQYNMMNSTKLTMEEYKLLKEWLEK